MLTVCNLEFRYPNSPFELNVPQLDIANQQHTAITGPSGCGKTTLLNLIAGIKPVHAGLSGEITLNHERLLDKSDQQQRQFRLDNVGFVFQDFRLIEYLSMRDNILLPVMLSSLPQDAEIAERLDYLIQKMGLSELSNRQVSQFSRGEQQRIAICRALLNKPQLILADEPTANLDADNAKQVWDLLFEQANEINATLIVVTHAADNLDRFSQVLPFSQINAGGQLCST
ncbi:MAG: ABC transporter ATP-binding protein [Planctomycetaceae bacterium]|jgi:putative ABC transport system ATP-binding protein|nr:ABC transporter ATP-binding protein [Planctomycetaceae bacterium]|tara:strand:- start:616 stop:1299 length:684 start_codon:yes stop_codon:yes gene_type:complete